MTEQEDVLRTLCRRGAFMVSCVLLACLGGTAGVRAEDGPTVEGAASALATSGGQAAPVQDVRELPLLPDWKPGDPIKEMPPRVGHDAGEPSGAVETVEPPSAAESRAPLPANFTKKFVVEGTAFTGVVPPDTTGAVGPNHFVQAVNASNGSAIAIFNKSGTRIAGPFALSSLFPSGTHPCRTSGHGDGVVVFDYQASRWLMMEFIDPSAGNTLCLYVSNNNDPVSGGWNSYTINTPEFPDYPKLGVAPKANAYVITVNDSKQRVFTFSRSAILAGAASVPGVVFTFPLLPGFSFQSLTPATVSSATAPPFGTPAYIARHRDTEVHGGTAPAGKDLLELFELKPNYTNPASSTVIARKIRVPDFNSAICGLTTLNCVPQPGTTQRLDPLREIVMQPLQYRKNGATEVLVGALTVDGNGADLATPYWFELRRSSSGWTFRQGGRYIPSATLHRWLPSMGIDKQGNIAMGFSSSAGSGTNFPSAKITGRLAGDPLSTLRATTTVKAGAGSQTFANRWGDYAAATVDPSDNCTFWFTTEYIPPGGNWRTTIGAFKFPGCT